MTSVRVELLLLSLVCIALLPATHLAEEVVMLDGEALARVIPGSFFFEGRSGPTQMRNAAAAGSGQRQRWCAIVPRP